MVNWIYAWMTIFRLNSALKRFTAGSAREAYNATRTPCWTQVKGCPSSPSCFDASLCIQNSSALTSQRNSKLPHLSRAGFSLSMALFRKKCGGPSLIYEYRPTEFRQQAQWQCCYHLWSPYVIGRYTFSCCGLFFFLFFPRLISAVGDWMFTILWHMVWP